MVDSALLEQIWASIDVNPIYISEIQQLCLASESVSAVSALDRLPLLFCELNGGGEEQVIPVITAWTLLRYAARLLDDVQDGDLIEQKMSEPVALNISTGLLFSVGLILNRLESAGVDARAAQQIQQKFYEELLIICSGQHLDLISKTPTLDEAWQIAAAKSGVFVGLICWAGGRVAGAEPKKLELYQQFGHALGLLDQIKDDLSDLWSDEVRLSDLQNGRNQSLPIAYAFSVLPNDEKEKLSFYLNNGNTVVAADTNARELIIQSGAGVYLTVQSTYYYQKGQALLDEMKLPTTIRPELDALLKKMTINSLPASC